MSVFLQCLLALVQVVSEAQFQLIFEILIELKLGISLSP